MSAWAETFLESLVTEIEMMVLRPTRSEVNRRLDDLAENRQYVQLLLTSLALLEHYLRQDDLRLPSYPTTGAMARLRDGSGSDYKTMVDSVALRHNLLQQSQLEEVSQEVPGEHGDKLENPIVITSIALAKVVRRKINEPQSPFGPW